MPDSSPTQLAGNLSTMSLADLLQWICLGHKTGTLHLQNGSIRKQVYIHEGKLVSAGSNISRERLGQFLLHHGRITEDDLRAALSDQSSSGETLGTILCRMNILDEGSLISILQLKAEETIYDLFLWNEGNFHFVADDIPKWALTQLRLDVTGLILEGLRRKDEMEMVRDTLTTNRMVLAVNEQRAEEAGALEGFDRRLVDLVRKGLTIGGISENSRAPEFVLLKRLHEFVEQGLLRVDRDLAVEQQPKGQLTFVENLNRCRANIDAEDLTATLDCINILRTQTAGEPGGDEALGRVEKSAAELIYSTMISPTHVPVLKCGLEELVNLRLSAEQGFIVSQIDGVTNIRSLTQISPVSEFKTLLIFRHLLGAEVIDLTGTGDIVPRED